MTSKIAVTVGGFKILWAFNITMSLILSLGRGLLCLS